MIVASERGLQACLNEATPGSGKTSLSRLTTGVAARSFKRAPGSLIQTADSKGKSFRRSDSIRQRSRVSRSSKRESECPRMKLTFAALSWA